VNKYEDLFAKWHLFLHVMSEQHCHLANKCEDIVNLQWVEAYCVATRTACYSDALLMLNFAE